jgi:hypothetical protein
MTECVYPDKLMSFKTHVVPEPVIQIPVLEVSQQSAPWNVHDLLNFHNSCALFCLVGCSDIAISPVGSVFKQGRAALEVINKTMGLAFDEFDLEVKLPSFSYEFSFHLERLALCMFQWWLSK